MATIKHIQTPDGVTHDIGGGGGSSTYTLTKNGNTITLTGSGGDVSSVVDANTTYALSLSGHTLTLTPSSGSVQSVTIPDDNTTYTIGVSGTTITLTPSSGTAQTITIPDATTTSAGVMSASDKSKLNGIASGAEVNVQADWNQSNSSADDYIKNKPSLATVATTGDYDDLTNKPTIPTVNDGTLTIQKNGSSVGTFTANQSGNSTANITVPTVVSDLTNDSGFTAVSYTQTLSSGTKIGEIDVDGVVTDIYAPSGGGGESGSSIAAGTIVPFGGSTAPNGWLFCDGSLVSRTIYADLFAAIGTTYGAGDGSTTFKLPDLRGRTAIGVNNSTLPNGRNPDTTGLSERNNGSYGGAETHTLNIQQMPSHTHVQNQHRHATSYYVSTGSGNQSAYTTTSNRTRTQVYTNYETPTNQNTGGGQAHNNMQPFVVTNYIISTGHGVGSVVNDVQVNGSSVVTGGVADIDLAGYVQEDANGDISITRNITAGGNVEAAGDVIAGGIPISQLHDWCLMYVNSKTITNTEAQITGVTLWSDGTGSYFDTSTANQVKIKKAGHFLVIVNFRLSAVTNTNNVKRLGLWKNGASNQMAMGRLNSWEDSTSFDVKNYAANDILKMYARAEDNNSTVYVGSIFIIPIA